MKTLFGASHALFHERLGWLDPLTAYRLPTAAVSGLGVALVCLLGAELWGLAAGLLAALLYLLLPRGLFHAGLAAFDAPIAALWFATLVAYLRALAPGPRRRRRLVVLAIAFGCALATKHNALMLPGVLLPHLAYVGWRAERGDGVAWHRALGRGVRRQVGVLVALAVGGPLVLVALWPWLWHAPIAHLREWIGFHLHHVHYNFEYLGDNWNAPPFPWHVALVTTLFVVPTATLAAALIGAVELARRARRGAAAAADRAPVVLLVLSALVSLGVFALGGTPIFGAEKHWAPAMPTLCLLAGVGVVAAARGVTSWLAPRHARLAPVGLALVGGAVVAAAAVETFAAQPYALSSYSALAGGPAGGADLGMNRQFWGTSARGVLPYLARFAPAEGAPAVPVYSHDAQPAWSWYARLGLLPAGLPDAGREDAGVKRSKIALVIHEKHFLRHDLLIWKAYGTTQPAYVLEVDGVPLVSVYVRSSLAASESP
jgi:4-amino-4-deoxy-L-arabinose transferase-like glycosyltransferase